MELRKKIFFKITGFFTILFFLTLGCAIVYLDYDHYYHSIEKAKVLTEFLSKQIEEMYISNSETKLQASLNKVVINHEEICGVYIKKGDEIIFNSMQSSRADDFNKIRNEFLNNISIGEDVFEFQNSEGYEYFDISNKIGSTLSTIHIVVSHDRIENKTSSELIIILLISFSALLIGILIADRISISLTKEINTKNNKLLKSEKQWHLLFNSSPMGIVIIDQNGIITQSNSSVKKLFNFNSFEIVGKHITESIECNAEKKHSKYFMDVSKMPFTESEITIDLAKGVKQNILRSPIPLISNDNSFNGAMIYYFDITERKRKEREINLYSTKLEDLVNMRTLELRSSNKLLSQEITERKIIENNLKNLNADKDKLFSIIAHDLRSPFNSLLGASDFLTSEIDDLTMAEIKELTSSLNHSAKNVFKLLENLLAWARLQTGQIDYSPEYLNIKEMVSEICDLYSSSALNKGVHLTNNITEDLYVYADENMLNTAFRNLISNSIKFTMEDDKISINCLIENDSVIISIVDTGIGMSKDIVEKLFKINHNSSTNGTNGESGTGLGLILTKEFIERNNGKLIVQSSSGVGSTFSFVLPLNKATMEIS